MLGLPKATELNRQLPKKAIFSKFGMNTSAKDKFDADIKKLTIVNEVSPATSNIEKGEEVTAFFVVLISLRNETYDDRNIGLIAKLIDQNMLFVLEHDGKAKLAIWHTKLIQTGWFPLEEQSVSLKGLNLDAVWDNLVIQVGGIQIDQGKTLDEQLTVDEEREKLRKQIERLEKLVRSEKQPKKKFELAQEIKILEDKLKG